MTKASLMPPATVDPSLEATTLALGRSSASSLGVRFRFPEQFKWGAACAAFQVEGAADCDGRGPSVWDIAAASHADRFYQQHTPATAADFYHRYADDVAMMRELGLTSFRFSISWSRLLPAGRGAVNAKGIAFYNRLIDLLLKNGIEPLVDLYHWDLPYALAEQGGFSNPGIVEDFRAYCVLCYENFGDRVKHWSTLNEPSAIEHFNPFCAANKDINQRLEIDRNILLMHQAAVRAFREFGGDGQIGAVIAYVPIYPRSLDPIDQRAADLQQAFVTARWLDPMLLGTYPDLLASHSDIAPYLPSDFLHHCAAGYEPLDFIGINYYTPSVVGHEGGVFLGAQHAEPFAAQSDYGFVNYPQGLFDAINTINQRYGHPVIYLTENGLAQDSEKHGDNLVNDDERIQYLREHLREVNRCIAAGADIRGYYYWSLMDTFESMSGYRYRFGLVHIDYDTLQRTPRKSWHYYQQCIRHNAVP